MIERIDKEQFFWGVIIGVITVGFMFVAYRFGEESSSKVEKEVLGEESQTLEIEEREVRIVFNEDCTNVETGSFVEGRTELGKYCVVYEGRKNAFEYLKLLDSKDNEFSFDYDESDFGVFVTSINNFHPDVRSKFWAFLVNGEMSMVGIGDYEIESGDEITFRVEEVEL